MSRTFYLILSRHLSVRFTLRRHRPASPQDDHRQHYRSYHRRPQGQLPPSGPGSEHDGDWTDEDHPSHRSIPGRKRPCEYQSETRDNDQDTERQQPVQSYTHPASNVSNTRAMASPIATLAHFASEPKIIGMGPIITTPPPLTRPSPFLDPFSMETATTPNPTSTSWRPAVIRSNTGCTGRRGAKGFCGGIA